MNRLLLIIFGLIFLGACSDDKEPELSKTELLAGTDSKSWFIYSRTPDDEECPATTEMSLDNTYIFFADGTFEYSSGEVTGDCDNLVDFIGTWKFTNSEEEIEVTGLQEKDNPENSFEFTFVDGVFKELSQDKFVLSVPTPDEEFIVEFRVRK